MIFGGTIRQLWLVLVACGCRERGGRMRRHSVQFVPDNLEDDDVLEMVNA